MRLKEAIKSVIFIGIFLLLLTGVSYIVRTNGHVKNRFAGFYAQEKNSIDVMLFGASTVGTSFSPGYMWGEYGFTSYPLSSNTQRPKAIKYLLEEAYKYQKPEVVVIELRMFTYEDETLATDEAHTREVTDNMRYSLQRVKTVNALTDQLDNKITYHLDILKFHSNWKMFAFLDEWKKVTYSKEDINKGFESPKKIVTQSAPQENNTTEMMPIAPKQEVILKDLMQFLKENGQKAVFVVTPFVEPKEYRMKMNYMKEVISKEGFPCINLNEDYEEIDFCFETDLYDATHTNTLGAKKCSQALGEYLVSNFELPDKRKDASYADWDESYETFMSVYESVLADAEKIKQEENVN